jgi:SNF2 family DNA or RNA helicase
MMINVGSKVRVKSSNNEGIVLEVSNDFAKVLINNELRWLKIDELEDISYTLLIDRFIRSDYDKPIEFILAIDAYRLLTEYKFNPYVLASSTKVEIFPHQIDEVIKIVDEQQRLLLADEVGLGKTITAALVASELNARGIVKRMLFVVPKSLTVKWRDELRSRFELDAKIIDSSYVKVYGNPFRDKEFCYVTSMDYLKQDHVIKLLKDANNTIDLVVIDEAHKLASGTDRYKLGEYLANISTFMLMLTATPHNGDDEDYLNRVRLLDPYISDVDASRYLFIRNIKEDVIDLDGKEVFPSRESKTVEVKLSNEEAKIHEMLDNYLAMLLKYSRGDKRREGAARFLSTLFRKRASSSIHALKLSLERRLEKLATAIVVDLDAFNDAVKRIREGEEEFDEEEYSKGEEYVIGYTPLTATTMLQREKDSIKEILDAINNNIISSSNKDSKFEILLNWIETIKKDNKDNDKDTKIVIFTEYRDTLNYLKDKLSHKYKVVSIDGSMSVYDRSNALNDFRLDKDIMVCTDAAGEGIDMQFCNIMINYDLPWNPNRLEQRMGRIHRIGQKRNVYYYNFVLDTRNTIDGYILEKLLAKIESIKEAMGDKVYDVLGMLISEDDIAKLYEELLMAPRDKWDAKVKIIDGIVEEKRKLVEKINSLLSGYRLDRSKLEDMKHILKSAVDSYEVKRFVNVFLGLYNGKIEEIKREEEICRIYMPKGLIYSYSNNNSSSNNSSSNVQSISIGSFSKDTAMKQGIPYFALGNNMVMAMLKHAARPRISVFKHDYLNGLLFIFLLSVYDARGNARDGKVVALLVDKEVKEVDVKSIWDLEGKEEKDSNIITIQEHEQSKNEITTTTSKLLDAYNKAKHYASNIIDGMLTKVSEKMNAIKEKNREKIEDYYSKEMSRLQHDIVEYERRLRDEPYLQGLITQRKNEINRLRSESQSKLKELEDAYKLYKVIELIGVAEITADKGSDVRLKIERAGMDKVLEYERKRANYKEDLVSKIKDVSDRLVGYDIESFDRVIEVKSFKDTGSIELTSHEWATAIRLKDEYWLYVVEDALGNGRIHTYKNPTKIFKDKVRKIPIIDYRYVIDDWKEEEE